MRWLVLLLAAFGSLSVAAADSGQVERNIRAGLSQIAPNMEVDQVSETPIKGLYEVMLGAEVIYMTGDGRYVLRGELLDLQQQANLTQEVRTEMRKRLLAELPKDEMIRFGKDNSDHVIYVFTDTDCGYCRKLHQDVPYLTKRGVEVRYLAYPRAGVDSDTYDEMASVWCAKDRQTALTRAKQDKGIEAKDCDNPVAKQYNLGRKMGVKGTPAIYLENGRALPGYVPPKRLLAILNGGS